MVVLRELGLDDDGDLAFDGGDLVILDGADAVAQRVAVRLRAIKGEWVFDLQIGTPWLQNILGAAARNSIPEKSRIRFVQQIIRERIAGTQGVARVDELEVDWNSNTRLLTVTGRATAEGGSDVPISLEVGL